jgi:hypothetical protein
MDSSRQAHNAEPQGLLPACVVGISSDDIRLKVIGIGSGSTVPYVVERILAQGSEVNKDRVFIPTGFQSKELIVEAQLRLGDVDQYPYIDVTIDGADEVDKGLSCIKGGGACQLREKVLAEAADTYVLFYFIKLSSFHSLCYRWIVVADYRKNSQVLGTNVCLCLIAVESCNNILIIVEARDPCRSRVFCVRQGAAKSDRTRLTCAKATDGEDESWPNRL